MTTQREIQKKRNYYLSKINKKRTQRSIKTCETKLWNKLPTRLLNYTNKERIKHVLQKNQNCTT